MYNHSVNVTTADWVQTDHIKELLQYLENMTVVASGPELEPAPNLSPTFLPELNLSKSLERNSFGEPSPGGKSTE